MTTRHDHRLGAYQAVTAMMDVAKVLAEGKRRICHLHNVDDIVGRSDSQSGQSPRQ